MPYQSVFRKNLFQDQVVIITGGGTGIGRCMAHELASLGATVALGSRKVTNPKRVKIEIESEGGHALAGKLNLRERESCEAFVAMVLEQTGRIDALVNNGGGQFMAPAGDLSENGWEAVIETNLTGTWHMTQLCFQQAFQKQQRGAIVSITMENKRGSPTMAHSGAARAGVENLTKSLALEWAPFGVRINAIAPGIINSSGLKKYPQTIRDQLPHIKKTIPAKRFGSEGEISGLATFLLSPAAGFITGQTIWADGGGSLWAMPYEIPDHDSWPEPYQGFDD